MGVKVESVISYITIRYTYMYERSNSLDKRLVVLTDINMI